MSRRPGLLLTALAVLAALFGTRQIGIAVADHKDRLLKVQLIVPRAQADAAGTFGEAQDVLRGSPAGPVGLQRSAELRASLSADVAALGRSWSTAMARRARADAAALNAVVVRMLTLQRRSDTPAAQALNVSQVAPAFRRLNAGLTQAADALAHQTKAADRVQREATLLAALAASSLLVLIIIGSARAGRRRDLAEREQRVLREAEVRLGALVAHSSDVIVVVAPDSTVRYEAGSVERVLGVLPEELHETKLSDRVDPDDVPLLLTLCSTVSHEAADIRMRGDDAVMRTCEIRATSLLEHPSWKGVVLHIWDISDRKALELELRLAQKLEAVGQLSAGIAHELNTPVQFVSDTNRFLDNAFADVLTVLDAYGELLLAAQAGRVTPELVRRVEEGEETADIRYLRERIPEAFVRSFDGIQRVSKIVSAMRAFAAPRSLDTSLVDINEAIRNTLIVAANEYKYVADAVTDFGELPTVECNASDINQVLLNIVINAADAIADVVGETAQRGRIEIRTWAEGQDVLISVADTGPGIPNDVGERIFDPFFTTKEVGRGTGQGLAISRTMVVERHHGSLTFVTRPGQGTTFLIRLPARAARASQPRRLAA